MHRCVARLAVVIIAGGLMAISAVAAQQAAMPPPPTDILPFIERLGFPAVAFYLMWRLVTQELRRSAEANERVAAALAGLAAEVAAMREQARR